MSTALLFMGVLLILTGMLIPMKEQALWMFAMGTGSLFFIGGAIVQAIEDLKKR